MPSSVIVTGASSGIGLSTAQLLAQQGAKPGGIVLMHDGGGPHYKTMEALPYIIDGLTKRGYRFVTVPELLELQQK